MEATLLLRETESRPPARAAGAAGAWLGDPRVCEGLRDGVLGTETPGSAEPQRPAGRKGEQHLGSELEGESRGEARGSDSRGGWAVGALGWDGRRLGHSRGAREGITEPTSASVEGDRRQTGSVCRLQDPRRAQRGRGEG